jgi:hypothetical protein
MLERLLKHASAAAAVALLALACTRTQPGQALWRAALAALPSAPVFAAVAAIYAALDLLAYLVPRFGAPVLEAPLEGAPFRVAMTAGIVGACAHAAAAAASSAAYAPLFTATSLALMGARWLAFREDGKHYLLFEFCYIANLAALYHLWLEPGSAALFQAVFAAANGPLALAVLTLQQPLLFHSWQHLASVFIHVCPAMLTWGLRWQQPQQQQPPLQHAVCASPPGCADVGALALLQHGAALLYCPWAMAYFALLFVALEGKVQRKGYRTLWHSVQGMAAMAPVLAALAARGFPPESLAAKVAYLALHAVGSLGAMALSAALFHSWALHTAWIAVLVTGAAWHASAGYSAQQRPKKA